MNKLYSLSLSLILIFFVVDLSAQNEDCDVFELLPALVPGQLSNDDIPVPCGFTSGAFYTNECSPCGNKIADDNCSDAPTSTLCELDGFQTSAAGYTNDLSIPTLGFCGGGTGSHNNAWIGFTAQTNVIELIITSFNCTAQGNSRGVQLAIVETNCIDELETVAMSSNTGSSACFGSISQGGLFNSSVGLGSTSLIPGNQYYIMIDGFAGGVCDIQIDVLDGFGVPEYDISTVNPGALCPDVLGSAANPVFSTGAQVDVNVGGIATTDLTFYWQDPFGNVIATTTGIIVGPNTVSGQLDGSFFTQEGVYTTQIIDNGSCCPLCTTVELTTDEPLPAAAAIDASMNGGNMDLSCNSQSVNVSGSPLDNTLVPAVEQFQIEDANGERIQLDVHIVSVDGRLDEITITRDIIENAFPGSTNGSVRIVYGFLESFLDVCFSDAVVEIAYDFRAVDVSIAVSGALSCSSNGNVLLTASTSSTNATYLWTSTDGHPISGGNTSQASVSEPGVYTLTFTDLLTGCEIVELIEVLSASDISFEQTSTDLDCFGDQNGSGEIVVLSGTPPFTISGAINNFTFDNLVAGTYPFTITDANECTSNGDIIITEPEMLTLNIQENASGEITATVNGGTPDYTYLWNDGSATATISSPVVNFIYQLLVVDQNGCAIEEDFIVSSGPAGSDTEDCNVFELLPTIVSDQMSNDVPSVPCGFNVGGFFVNECSPCGIKIADDDCSLTPVSSLCNLDGFQTVTVGYTNDLNNLTLGYCGPGTGTQNNSWIGFTAQTNMIEMLITTSNCASQGSARGIQVAIVETNCLDQFETVQGTACIGGVGQGGLFNASEILSSNALIPGNEYYVMIDGFAGGVCDVQIDVIDGFGIPEYDISTVNPGALCPDVVGSAANPVFGTGAQVDVSVGGVATTDLTFYWLNPSGNVIATTTGNPVGPNTISGQLDGSFFTQEGVYSVQIIDNGSCCPLCTTIELITGEPLSAAATIEASTNGGNVELSCNTQSVNVIGSPLDETIVPVVEQFQIENANGERIQLDVHIVNVDGRLNQITITKELIDQHYPDASAGEVNIIYGFLLDFTSVCFSEAFVTIPFDFSEFQAVINVSGELGCDDNAMVVLDASNSALNNEVDYQWASVDGFPIVGSDTNMATVSNAGLYSLMITDLITGCSDIASVEVTEVEQLSVEIMSFDVSCFGGNDGFIEVNVLAGTPPLTVSGTLLELPANNLEAKLYPFTITDANGCSESFEVEIMEPSMLVVNIELLATGELEASASGGTPDYRYLWNSGDTTAVILEPLLDFEYEVTITDANGCTETEVLIISDVAELTINENDVNLFPNPNQGYFQFSFDRSLDLRKVIIYNIHGQVVKQLDNLNVSNQIDFELINMVPGTYLLEAHFAQGIHRQKMLLYHL